jgi:stage V sporulation protein G
LKISAIRIIPFEASQTGSKVRAYAEIEIDDVLTIRGFKIVESKQGGLFIGYPSLRSNTGEYKEIVIAKSPEFASELRRSILEAYRNWGSEITHDGEENANA